MDSGPHHRRLIAIALLLCAVFPAPTGAQSITQRLQLEDTLSWEELAVQSGLTELKSKKKNEYQVDVVYESPQVIHVLKASIQLTPEEWTKLESGGIPLLNPWVTGKIDNNIWKSTVDLGLPFEGKVDVDRLEMNDKAVILHRPDLHSTRVYILSPNADGKSSVLYYFFKIF